MPIRRKTTTTSIASVDEVAKEKNPVSDVSNTKDTASFAVKIIEKRKSIETHVQELLDQIVRQATLVDETEKRSRDTQKEVELKRTREQQEKDFTRDFEEKKQKAELQEELRVMRTETERECAEKREKLERESEEITSQKAEFASLKKQVESFPKVLEQQVADAAKSAQDTLAKDFEVQKKLLLIESQNTIKLLEQDITALRAQLKDKEELVSSLTTERNAAIGKIQELATEAMKRSQQTIIHESQPHVAQ